MNLLFSNSRAIVARCDNRILISRAPLAARPCRAFPHGIVALRGASFSKYATMKSEKICGVYRFVHIPTGKSCVGSSFDVLARRKANESCARRKIGGHFQRQLSILGIENFRFEIVEKCTIETRLDREYFYIAFFNSFYPNGFNLAEDPRISSNYLFSDAHRKHISDSKKGQKLSEKSRRLISEAHTGMKRSEEARANMSAAQIGNTHNLGKVASEQKRAKISAAHKGKILSAETKMKIKQSWILRKLKGEKPYEKKELRKEIISSSGFYQPSIFDCLNKFEKRKFGIKL